MLILSAFYIFYYVFNLGINYFSVSCVILLDFILDGCETVALYLAKYFSLHLS